MAASALAGGCGDAQEPVPTPVAASLEAGALRGANLLLVTIDTLRADALGAYGNGRRLTPRMDRLATEGVRFERAYAHAPMTLPSHASILTGAYPFAHGVRDNGAFRLDESHVTLAEILRDAGYRNAAFVGAFVLDVRYGLGQGFDPYDDYYGEQEQSDGFEFAQRRAPAVLAPAAAWIEQQAGPWFAWVHLFDPHAPYDPPEPFLRGRRAAPYEGEVAYVDNELAGFLDRLQRGGALDDTLIVLTADHGESLGEHGEQTHGAFAYDATLRVPLVFWHASGLEPTVVATPAAHVDIVPTVLEALGARAPEGLPGAALLSSPPDAGARTPIYFEAVNGYLAMGLAPLTGLVDGQYKYIDLPVRELYDLPADAREGNNLADALPAVAARYRDALESLLGAEASAVADTAAGAPSAAGTAGSPALPGLRDAGTGTVDPDGRRRLEALGYLRGAPPPPTGAFTAEDDPKNVIHLIEKLRSAWTDYGAGRADAAIGSLHEVIAERPGLLLAYETLASMLVGTGRLAEAVAVLDAAHDLHPDSPSIAGKLGFYLGLAGDTSRAIELLREALARSPADVELMVQSAIIHSSAGDQDEARALLGRAAQLDPSSASVEHNLGMTYLREQDYAPAIVHFRRAIELAPDFWNPYEALGGALFERGQKPEAVEAWKRVIELNPAAYDTIYNLAVVLAELGRDGEALLYADRYVAEAPGDPEGKARLRAISARVRGSGGGRRP